jgi:hypothetical protein
MPMNAKLSERDAQRILAEARSNVERLKDSEQRFAAEREALEEARQLPQAEELFRSIESRNDRHRRELEEQEQRFERERRQQRREERHHQQADWSHWDRWADARIAIAIAHERKILCTTMAAEVRKAIDQIYDDIGDEVRQLRLEITELKATLEASFEQLRSVVKSDNAKVVEMPSQRRATTN